VLWNRGHVLVADMGTDYVAEVDPADGRVINRIRTGDGAHQLFASPDGRLIYVNNRAAGTITVLDATSHSGAVHTYHIPGGPDDLAFAPDGRIWITCRFAEKIAILDPGEWTGPECGGRPASRMASSSTPPLPECQSGKQCRVRRALDRRHTATGTSGETNT
jgi:DNA-binding beta-propeller fold protein YncE